MSINQHLKTQNLTMNCLTIEQFEDNL